MSQHSGRSTPTWWLAGGLALAAGLLVLRAAQPLLVEIDARTRIRKIGGQLEVGSAQPEWLTDLTPDRSDNPFCPIKMILLDDRPQDPPSESDMRHALAAVGQFRDLQLLGLGIKAVGDPEVEVLKSLPKVQVLSLRNSKITNTGLQNLRGLANLARLDLSGTDISDAGLGVIAGLTTLNELILDHTRVTDEGLKRLTGLRSLRSLSLVNTGTSDEAIAELQQALPHAVIVDD